MQRLTITRVTRWQKHFNMVGYGHMYQGRFISFPIEQEGYCNHVMRYTERNALRGNLASRAEEWPWGLASGRRPSIRGRSGCMKRQGN